MSALEKQAALLIRAAGVKEPAREYHFCGDRRWRFDFAWPEERVAIEVEGGGWVRGRHHRPEGFTEDCRKYNRAVLEGWRVLRYTADNITDILDDLAAVFGINGGSDN